MYSKLTYVCMQADVVNAPTAPGSCLTFNVFKKQQNGEGHAHTPYFLVAYFVEWLGKQVLIDFRCRVLMNEMQYILFYILEYSGHMYVKNWKLFLPKWSGYRDNLNQELHDQSLHMTLLLNRPLSPQKCYFGTFHTVKKKHLKFVVHNIWRLQLAQNFFQIPFISYTLHTGGLLHPIKSVVSTNLS